MKRVKVWDVAVRVSHVLLGALVLGAFLTSEEDETVPLHVRLGLVLLGVVLFRLVWGFVGSRHARFKDFVKPPREVLAALKGMVRGKPGVHLGHNPVGGMMVVALLATLSTIAATGIAVAMGPEWNGPLAGVLTKSSAHAVKEVHEVAAHLLLVLVAFHVAGVVVSSLLERQNLFAGMVTGYKRGDQSMTVEPSASSRVGGFVAALVVAVAAVLLVWKLLPVGTAQAASSVLSQYESRAKQEDPAFKGFDAERGRALYVEEHPGKKETTSCVTCHTSDPRRQGRSPAGKFIEPLAPSANPQRFTDIAKSDKWFDRNCKQVLGRPCTATERGDFITYLSTL